MENKGLELLETYENKYTFASQFNGDRLPYYQTRKMLEPIEKELKDYYALKKECEEAKWYQEHRAIEIINKKNVDIRGIKETKNVHEYNAKFPTTLNEFLEEQEYDLLKEVLANDKV